MAAGVLGFGVVVVVVLKLSNLLMILNLKINC